LTLNDGCSIAWDGVGQKQVPSGECVDLTYVTPGNDDNGYFFQCATPALGNNCVRELSIGGMTVNTKTGSCNEGVGTNTLVYFNVTGPKPGSGVTFEKENIMVQAFTASPTYTCLPALGNGQAYAHGISSICSGGIAKWTNYECSDSNYDQIPPWLNWTSVCGKNTKVNSYECISSAVERNECDTKYATVEYGNKTLSNISFTCKMHSNNGNNW